MGRTLPLLFRDYLLEQSNDETLTQAFGQVKLIDGQLAQPNSVLLCPTPFFFLSSKVMQDIQSKEETTQLLVPNICMEMLF